MAETMCTADLDAGRLVGSGMDDYWLCNGSMIQTMVQSYFEKLILMFCHILICFFYFIFMHMYKYGIEKSINFYPSSSIDFLGIIKAR